MPTIGSLRGLRVALGRVLPRASSRVGRRVSAGSSLRFTLWVALGLAVGPVALGGSAGCRSSATSGPLSPPDPTLDRPIGIETQQPSALDRRLERLAEALEKARVEHHVPGMAVAVVKDDTLVMARGFGLADVEAGRPATPETLFSIGSSTKAFTAALVGIQAEGGALSWDDPITRHVPEFKLALDTADNDASATIRDLLSHRTGFTRMSMLWAAGGVPRKQLFEQASHAEPWAPYRQRFLYNNVMYAAAGEASARSAGKSWSELLSENLLGPLGMTDTTADFDRARDDSRRAQGYAWRSVRKTFEAVPPRDITLVAPAGAIFSNALDMSRWVRVQLDEGKFEGREVIPASVVAEIQSPQFEIAPGTAYGLGWFVETWKGKTVIHHGGNIDGYAAMVAMVPEEDLGFVLLTNVGVTPLQNLSRALVWDALLGESGGESGGAGEDLAPYTGRYIANFGPFKDAAFVVTVDDGRLFVDVPGQMNYEVAAPGEDGRRPFAMTDTVAVSFEKGPGGEFDVMRMHQGGLDFELFREGYVPAPEIPLAELEPLLGTYEGSELGRVQVLVAHNRLAVDIPKQMVFELDPPDAAGRRSFRVKPKIAVEFVGKGDQMRLHEDGKTIEFTRVGKVKQQRLPTVDALQKRRGLAKIRRAIEKAGVLELSGKIRMPQSGLDGTVRLIASASESRLTLDFGPYGRIEEFILDEGAWTITSFSPPEQHEGKFLTQARLMAPLVYLLDWTQAFDRVSVVDRGVLGGRDTIVLEMTAEDVDPYQVAVADDTGEVLEVKFGMMLDGPGTLATTLELGDYKPALGVLLPHHLEVVNDPNGRTVWNIESIRPFSGDPSGVFRPPSQR